MQSALFVKHENVAPDPKNVEMKTSVKPQVGPVQVAFGLNVPVAVAEHGGAPREGGGDHPFDELCPVMVPRM